MGIIRKYDGNIRFIVIFIKSCEEMRYTNQNLIAVKKSKKVQNKGAIIICAHYDSTKDSVGANDNASEVSLVLETTRLLKNVSSDYELEFIYS
jgi:Zn-dependent M28 family amino/carboxypeptidase